MYWKQSARHQHEYRLIDKQHSADATCGKVTLHNQTNRPVQFLVCLISLEPHWTFYECDTYKIAFCSLGRPNGKWSNVSNAAVTPNIVNLREALRIPATCLTLWSSTGHAYNPCVLRSDWLISITLSEHPPHAWLLFHRDNSVSHTFITLSDVRYLRK